MRWPSPSPFRLGICSRKDRVIENPLDRFGVVADVIIHFVTVRKTRYSTGVSKNYSVNICSGPGTKLLLEYGS